MGFSSPDSPPELGTKRPDTNFLGNVGNYFEQRFPIAGGLANMVFGSQTPPPGAVPSTAPSMNMNPQQPQSQPDFITMNAKPEKGSEGFSTVMRLLSGGF